jgi:hypothetical protein
VITGISLCYLNYYSPTMQRYICKLINIHILVNIHVYVHIYIYTHIYVCIYTHVIMYMDIHVCAQVVAMSARLLLSLVEHNPQANSKLYLSGVFYFGCRFTGSSFLPIAQLFEATHVQQSFQNLESIFSSQSVCYKSFLLNILPKVCTCGGNMYILTYIYIDICIPVRIKHAHEQINLYAYIYKFIHMFLLMHFFCSCRLS